MRTLWLHIILLMMAAPASTQRLPDLRFSHLTEKDGLSNNSVRYIAQDADGVIWIATENGLNRFDGYGFRTFYASSGDLPSSRTNRIHELLPDNKGRIWGSTTDGIFYFDTHTQRLIPWQPPGSDSGNREAFSRSYHIFLDSSQSPWLTTFATITPRSDHLLWAGRGNMVYQLDAITHDTLRTWQGPANLVIQDIHFDHYDRCWISTWGNGIYLFDPKTNSWQPFAPSDKRSVVRGGADWRFDGQWYMVFACSTPALLLVNEKDLSFYAVPFDYSPLQFMQGPFVDRQNILWLTTSDGVYYSTSSSNLFEVFNIPVLPSKVEKPSFAYVYCMKEDSTGYWLSKRYYGGIFWYDRQWRLRRVWQGTKVLVPGRFGAPGATSGEAFDFQRVGHDMFISTESGLSVLNLDHFTWTILKPADAINPRLRTILVDNPHAWWIRSFNQGVYVFDPIARKFTHHYVIIDTSRNGQTWILHSLVEDKQRRIFASANTGLFQYNPSTDRFEPVALKGVAVPSRELFGLATDSSGMLLIGGENGLFVYNPLTHAIERTLKEDNKIGVVSRVCTDTRQNVWLSSVSGYWCWLRRQDKVIHFDYSLGLPTTDDGAMYRTTDGTVYAGAKDAVIRFFPRRIMEYRSTAGAKIVDAVVNDSIAAFRFNSDGSRELNLPPDRSSFSVDFDIINYDLLFSNQYLYKLTPGNKEWQHSETGHLTFYNLQPGSYTLDVKGASKLAGTFTNTDTLGITVRPYWYQSSWFRIGSLVLLCLIAAWLVRYRINTIRRQAAFRHKMTEMELTALRAQMNPHFIFNSLNSIENFIMQNEKRLASDYLNKFATLVRMILENSRAQAVPLQQDMEAMQLYVDLEKIRFGDKFGYETEIDDALLKGDYRVAPLLIQPFVENAIVHGIAPSEKAGLYLKVAVRLQGEFIHYTIEDNGIGRTESMAYSRKYRPGHRSLGLAISRERIDLINRQHGAAGTLDIVDLYDDHQPAGTRVLLTINVT